MTVLTSISLTFLLIGFDDSSNFNALLESFSNFKEREAMIAALLDAGISPKQLLKKQVTLYENMFMDMDTLVGDITLAEGLKAITSMCFSKTNNLCTCDEHRNVEQQSSAKKHRNLKKLRCKIH